MNRILAFVLTTVLAAAVWHGGIRQTVAADDPTGDQPFRLVADVLKSPRCLNCHQSAVPLQGDEARRHRFNVRGGPTRTGVAGQLCTTCHGDANNPASGVPGAPHWQLAPVSMDWAGRTDAELCTALIDKARNGGRDGEALLHHMVEDPLVQWAWTPGRHPDGRTRAAPAVSQDRFHDAVRRWVAGGLSCDRL